MAGWSFPVVLGLLAVPSAYAARRNITIAVIDESTGRPTPCRILLQQQGNYPLPADTRVRYDPPRMPREVKPQAAGGSELWFATSGVATNITISVGTVGAYVAYRIEKGHEFERLSGQILVPVTGASRYTFMIRRWIDMRAAGYVSVDNHVHTDAIRESLGAWLAAEDINLGTMLYWHNGVDPDMPLPPPDPEVPHSMRVLLSAPDSGQVVKTTSTVLDAEKEDGFGAVYMLHNAAEQRLEWTAGTPNFIFLRQAQNSHGFVAAQAGWSREIAVDTLLGLVDAVGVCNNVFEFHAFQTRSEYSNLLNVSGFPTYPNTFDGMFAMNTETYYRLLNWGLRVAVGGGSASGLEFKRTTVGYSRTYVRSGLAADPDTVFSRWATGQAFCTTGGIVVDVVEETTEVGIGGVVRILQGEDRTLRFRVTASSESNTPLTALHLIVNGKVIPVPLDPQSNSTKQTGVVSIPKQSEGAWACGVAHGNDTLLTDKQLGRYSDPNVMRVLASRHRFAHSSPIYVTVGGVGARVQSAITEGEKLLARFEEYAQDAADPQFAGAVAEAVKDAHSILMGKKNPLHKSAI